MGDNIIVVHYASIMRVKVKHIIALVVFGLLLSNATLFAGGDQYPPPPNIEASSPPPPVGLPIDFGISALIAAGLGLGIYHIRNRK
ncbi:hypothetical protein LB465_08770 [Salegentibacter sp. LM13S]|uniref:PID-CTERM protein-sorting domain-containing protein n=1 Tax=Salegentibacter lacus TaxID=2873599 RepID=UPI001CCE90B3|nr:hypothetical protein [Salegentibacter lacus]MBZ9630870.1 hypothetical protein [Salegentibacter lacus]